MVIQHGENGLEIIRRTQVSRRLARRLEKAMKRRQCGTALLAARTYGVLLGGLPAADVPLLAWELVAAPVVPGSLPSLFPLPSQ